MGDVNYRILLVEDCKKGMSKIYTDFLYSEFRNLHINLVTSIADAEHRLEIEDFSAVLLAPNLPHYDGTSLVNYLKKVIGGIPLVVLLDGSNAGMEDDVKKISVDRIYRDGSVNIKEIEDICAEYEANKERQPSKKIEISKDEVVSPLKSENGAHTLHNNRTLEQEIQKHREALLKARSESESSKEAVLKAQQETEKLKEEAALAREEAEKVRVKVEELKNKNNEQSKELEEGRAKIERAIKVGSSTEKALDDGLSKIIEEKESLGRTVQNLQSNVSEKDSAITRLTQDVEHLKKVIEDLENNKSTLEKRLHDSEVKGEALMRETHEALDKSRRDQEEARVAYERAQEAQDAAKEANQQRDEALEKSRLSDEHSKNAEDQKGVALQKEAVALDAQRKSEEHAVELTKRLEKSERMVENLNQVVHTLEERCEELEAGQAALIEAEHVGLERERSGRELAEGELKSVKIALGELEQIERERAKLEELLKDGQKRENELIKEKTGELEKVISEEREKITLQKDKISKLEEDLEERESENKRLQELINNHGKEITVKDEMIKAIKDRVVAYKQTINELGKQREEQDRKYAENYKEFEVKTKDLLVHKDRVGVLEGELEKVKEEAEQLRNEKNSVMESYTNKTEAVQKRLAEAEEMLKECEWKLEQETSVKDLALERVMELGVFEEQVSQLEVDIASEKEVSKGLKNQNISLKEEIESLKNSEIAMKDRMQLEILEKDMKVDSLSGELEGLKEEYQKYKERVSNEKEALTNNAQEVQDVLHETSAKLKDLQWKTAELEKEKASFTERIEELEREEELIGSIHQENEELKSSVEKSTKKIAVLSSENEDLIEKVEKLKSVAAKIVTLQEKAELVDRVAGEIEDLHKALKEEQIKHRKMNVELRKAHERESHLEELKSRNKELGWELVQAKSQIGQFIAREEERGIVGVGYAEKEVVRLKKELKSKEDTLDRIISEKEAFTKEQLLKVAQLTELYEKAQTDRLNLMEKLGREE